LDLRLFRLDFSQSAKKRNISTGPSAGGHGHDLYLKDVKQLFSVRRKRGNEEKGAKRMKGKAKTSSCVDGFFPLLNYFTIGWVGTVA
jgi:hypothetical protein